MLELKRNYQPIATYGNLNYKSFNWKTIELPWKENAVNISCIPADVYDYEVVGPTENIPFPHVWIKDVPKRSGIKIHIANFLKQLRGCIAIGLFFKDIDKDGAIDVSDSKVALEDLLSKIPKTGKIKIS